MFDSQNLMGYTRRIETEQQVMLLFSVLYFYFTIFYQMGFLVLTRCYHFNTLRERAGFGSNMRLKVDFLSFVKDDVHWMLLLFTHYSLFIYIIANKNHSLIPGSIDGLLFGAVTLRFLSNLYVNHMVYFSKTNYFKNGVFNALKSKKPFYVFIINIIIDLCCLGALIYVYVTIDSLFRDAFILFDIVLRILIWFNIYLEHKFFSSQVREWKKQYILQQTLYQIEVQKNMKDKVNFQERGESLVDENFTEEEIIA